MSNEISESEWSYILEADDVEAKPIKITISPDEQQKAQLVNRLNILAIDSLSADLELRREQGNMVVHISGHIKAALKQACVVTLEPVETYVDEAFEAWFADVDQAISLSKAKHDRMTKTGGAEVPILDEKDDPEPIIDGKIDLGELVTQHMSLAINPYPHAEGVHYEYGDDEPKKVPEEFKTNPFAALKDWKSKLDD